MLSPFTAVAIHPSIICFPSGMRREGSSSFQLQRLLQTLSLLFDRFSHANVQPTRQSGNGEATLENISLNTDVCELAY
jgi:hypothetical protein